MTSKRVFEANPMKFRFNMYDHDYYHSLLLRCTFNISYSNFTVLHDFKTFKRDFITNICSAANVNPRAINLIRSESSFEHFYAQKHIVKVQIHFDSAIVEEQFSEIIEIIYTNILVFIPDFKNIILIFDDDTINVDALFITDEPLDNDILNNLESLIHNHVQNSLGNCSLSVMQQNNVCISAVIHFMNKNDLTEFKNSIENDLYSTFSSYFYETYADLLFLESKEIEHQKNNKKNTHLDIILYYDWIQKMKETYTMQKTHYQRAEQYRENVFKNAYNDFEATHLKEENGEGKTSYHQWLEHISIILNETVYLENPYIKKILFLSEDKIKNNLEYKEKVDIYNNDEHFQKHVSESYRYSTNHLGNLINNHNVQEILTKLYDNGYFQNTFNPLPEHVDLEKYPLYSQLQDNDEIVFPVVISSIYGFSDDISMQSNDNMFHPFLSLYTIHIRCIQKTENNT